MKPEKENIIFTEIEKFFDKKYIKYFNEIKKQDDYSKTVFNIDEIEWDEEDEINNGKKEDFYADQIKMKKIKFIKYYSPINKEIKEKNKKHLSRLVINMHEFITKEKGIKKIFGKMKSLNKKQKILDKMILYIFLICEVISSIKHFTFNDGKVFASIFYSKFFKNYKYCIDDNNVIILLNDYIEYYKYFDKKNDSIMKFISEKEEDFGNFFSDEFYYLFFINEIKMEQKILKTEEICGICLTEYNNDMISYCGIHFICLKCYEETDVEKCINKCETKELALYKKT